MSRSMNEPDATPAGALRVREHIYETLTLSRHVLPSAVHGGPGVRFGNDAVCVTMRFAVHAVMTMLMGRR